MHYIFLVVRLKYFSYLNYNLGQTVHHFRRNDFLIENIMLVINKNIRKMKYNDEGKRVVKRNTMLL